MERKFINSGILGLDEILGGGFLEGSVVTVAGSTGSGRSTFGLQFLYNGATVYDEPGLYISIEESKQDFFFHMSGYSWDVDKVEKERKLIFLDYPIYEVDQIINQQTAIQEIINTTGVKRVVIDSVLPIALFFPDKDERKKGFLKLIDNIRKWGVTTLLLAEITEQEIATNLPRSAYGIESFTDGWINIHYKYNEEKDERERSIEVVKMKGVCHSTKSYPATIDEDGFRLLVESKPLAAVKKPTVKKDALSEKKAQAAKKRTLGIKKLLRKTK